MRIKPRFFIYFVWLFIICEILCRISLPWLANRGAIPDNCDSAWRIKWIARHQGENRNLTNAYYGFDVFSPSRGWGLRPNMRNLTCFGDKIVNSNSQGVRGALEHAYEKTPGKTRILILGDSFTFGEGCSDNETYPYYLQQLMPQLEVINLGIHGYGHDQMLLYLTEEGLKYKPDIVMLGFMYCDIERNTLSFRDYAKPKFELINGKLHLRNSPVPSIESTLKSEIWKSKFLDLLNIFYNELWQKTGGYRQRQQDVTNAILREIVLNIRKVNATPVFLYLTNIQSEKSAADLAQEEKDFARYWQLSGVVCIFPRSYIQSARKEGRKIKTTGHFDSVTNQVIAFAIKRTVELMPPPKNPPPIKK